MSQNKNLLAFRARLKTRGYYDVSIKRCIGVDGQWKDDEFGQPLYYISCVEPLLGFVAKFTVSERQMKNWPGIEFDNCGFFERVEQIDLFDVDFDGGVFV